LTATPALWLAVTGNAAAVVYLVVGLIASGAAPGGLEGALQNDALFRVLLVRIVTAIAFGVVGTVLLAQRPAVGGLVLIATAVASTLTIPSAFWTPSAWLYGIAGVLGLSHARTLFARRLIVAFGVLSVSLTVLVTIYARVPGALLTRHPSGDLGIPIPTPEPELGLTPIPARTTLMLTPDSVHLSPGETAVIALNVATDTPVQSVAFDLAFDPRVLAVQEVVGGEAMAGWANEHDASVIALAGVDTSSPPGLRALGVALVSADGDAVGPSGGGTLAVLTIRAQQAGVTQLRLQSPIVRSRVGGRNRRHPASNSPPPSVQIVVG